MTNFIKQNWLWLACIVVLTSIILANKVSSNREINKLNNVIEDTKLDYTKEIAELESNNNAYIDSLQNLRKKVSNLYYKINQLSQKTNQIKKDKDEATNNINGYSVKQLDSILTNFRIRDTTEARNSNRIN